MGDEAAVPPGFWDRVQKIADDAVSKFARSGFLRNASITGGAGLTVADGGAFKSVTVDGVTVFYVGGGSPRMADGSPQPVIAFYRADGSIALGIYDGDPTNGFQQFLALYDRAGNIIMGDDTDSGQGLARPWVPIPLYPGLGVTALPVGTTSGTFDAVWIGRAPKQLPRLAVTLLATAPAGVTAEVRVTVGSTQVGSTVTVTGGTLTDTTIGPAVIAGAHMSEARINVEARITGGAGRVGVFVVRCEGRQS